MKKIKKNIHPKRRAMQSMHNFKNNCLDNQHTKQWELLIRHLQLPDSSQETIASYRYVNWDLRMQIIIVCSSPQKLPIYLANIFLEQPNCVQTFHIL